MGDLAKGRKSAKSLVTPLMRAAELGHMEAVELLLRSKAAVHQCDSKGWSALCYALGSGHICTARRLAEVSQTTHAGVSASSRARSPDLCMRTVSSPPLVSFTVRVLELYGCRDVDL